MEFGLFTEFHSPPGVSEAAAFDESLGQMKAAEDMGYDAVWLAEIHPERSIGTCVPPGDRLRARGLHAPRQDRDRRPVLPLSHPLRLAVDVATVDHISKGRLEFGVGRSGLPGHYQGFNIPYSEKSRPVPRDPRHPDQGVDTRSILPSWKVLSVPGRLHHAQAVPEAASAGPYRGHDARDVSTGGTARSSGVRGGPHGLALGPEAAPADVSHGLARVGARRTRRRRREHAAVRGGNGAPGPRGARGEHDGLLPLRSARR